MNNPQNPDDPDSLSLKSGRAGAGSRPDFGNVRSGASSTEPEAGSRPDFGNVRSAVRSTEELVGGSEYTVRQGDTLSHIAQAQYGRASQWRRIYEANRDQLDDPDRIQPGQVLKIPAPEAREDDRTSTPPHGDKR